MFSRLELLQQLSFTPRFTAGGRVTRREQAHRDWELYRARGEGFTLAECQTVWRLAEGSVRKALQRAAALVPADGGVVERATPVDAGKIVADRTARARDLITEELAGTGRFRRAAVRNGKARRFRSEFDRVLSVMVADGAVVEVLDANGAEWIATAGQAGVLPSATAPVLHAPNPC